MKLNWRQFLVTFVLILTVRIAGGDQPPVTVNVFSLPSKQANSPTEVAAYRIVERFLELHPQIRLESSSALHIEGASMDAAPLMAIAGGTSPDIIYVNFRQSHTYISQGFLYPLDEYVAQLTPEDLADRVPTVIRPVVYREGPTGEKHWWAIPQRTVAIVLMYRRDLFAAAGLDPDQPPRNWEELLTAARAVTDPGKGIYAMGFGTGPDASHSYYAYLCSAGVEAVKQLPDGEWRAAFDTPEAVTAYDFVHQLQTETVTKSGRTGPLACRGAEMWSKWSEGKLAMMFSYLSSRELASFNPQLLGVAPVPQGPTGKSSAEVNALMSGIFAGQKDKRVRDAAWEYLRFIDSPEARRIFTETMVEQGGWRMINPSWLRRFGFEKLARMTTPGLQAAFDVALEEGTPEPFGKNCQYAYNYLSLPMEKMYFSDFSGLSRIQRRAKIQEFLTAAVRDANERMIGVIPEGARRQRNGVAWVVAAGVAVSFGMLIWLVFGWAKPGQNGEVTEHVAAYKNRMALALVAPALLLVLMWQYWPLARGSLMAFQNYSVMGGSPWVGISNFADVLFDSRFWLSLKNAFHFCGLWMLLGFLPPVFLAILLQEIPVGKMLFRVLFYLPAVVSGVVILFMWRGIYDPSPDGLLNRILHVFNIPPQIWLLNPKLAMLCIVFPLAWASLGPGCIIYLAALKGIPDELYEAADIDGASFFKKIRYIVLPYLKPLLLINLVGALIFGFKSADAVLAMTGGGPNLATHVVGYEIWQRSFLYLQFGHGTAMAWILGVLLLAFTAYQLRILNRVEFRTTGGKP